MRPRNIPSPSPFRPTVPSQPLAVALGDGDRCVAPTSTPRRRAVAGDVRQRYRGLESSPGARRTRRRRPELIVIVAHSGRLLVSSASSWRRSDDLIAAARTVTISWAGRWWKAEGEHPESTAVSPLPRALQRSRRGRCGDGRNGRCARRRNDGVDGVAGDASASSGVLAANVLGRAVRRWFPGVIATAAAMERVAQKPA